MSMIINEDKTVAKFFDTSDSDMQISSKNIIIYFEKYNSQVKELSDAIL